MEKIETAGVRDTTGLLLYQFWAELLEEAAKRTRVHVAAEPRREAAVEASAEMAGLRYNYAVREHTAGVELCNRDRGKDRENGHVFDALQATEDAIGSLTNSSASGLYRAPSPQEFRRSSSFLGSSLRRRALSSSVTILVLSPTFELYVESTPRRV